MQRRSIVDRAIARSAYPDPPPSPAIRRRDANQPVATRIADIEREADAVADERPPVAIETAPEAATVKPAPEAAAIDETRSAEAATEATAAKAAAEPTATEPTAEPTDTEDTAKSADTETDAAAATPAAAEPAAAPEAAAAMAATLRKGIAGDRGDGKRRRERQCGYCFTDHGHFLCLSPQGERMLFCS